MDEFINENQKGNWLFNPIFPKDWEFSSLYSLAKWVNGLAFRDIQFSMSGLPVIKIAELKNGITDQTKLTEDKFDNSVLIQSGDMLYSWSGQPETSLDVHWYRGPTGWLNQHIFKVTPKEQINPGFFFYLLKYVKPNLIAIARNKQTTGLGHVTKSDLEKLNVAYPTETEQRAIAHILGTLDDKIELNRRMNETLEGIARALFKSWFIDFDPVRAKAEGRRPFGMDEETAALFPSEFEDSELGEIPKGWSIKPLDEVANFLNGLAMQKYPPTGEESLPVIKIAELNRGINEGTSRASGVPDNYIVNDGDVLFSWSGSLELKIWCEGKGALNQHLFKVTSEDYPSWFYYQWVTYHLDGFRKIAASKATTMGHIQRYHLTEALTVVPTMDIINIANNIFMPLFELYVNNLVNNRYISRVRDGLLPKLISGELRVDPSKFGFGPEEEKVEEV